VAAPEYEMMVMLGLQAVTTTTVEVGLIAVAIPPMDVVGLFQMVVELCPA